MSGVLPLQMLAGTETLEKTEDGWSLLGSSPENGASREFRRRVSFERIFGARPVVSVSLVGFDIDNGDFARLRVAVDAIDAAGFTLVVSTSCGTQVHQVEVGWLALGH